MGVGSDVDGCAVPFGGGSCAFAGCTVHLFPDRKEKSSCWAGTEAGASGEAPRTDTALKFERLGAAILTSSERCGIVQEQAISSMAQSK